MRDVNWGLIWSGIAALAVVTITCILVVASDSGPSGRTFNSFWLFILLPIVATLAGAIVLVGREPS